MKELSLIEIFQVFEKYLLYFFFWTYSSGVNFYLLLKLIYNNLKIIFKLPMRYKRMYTLMYTDTHAPHQIYAKDIQSITYLEPRRTSLSFVRTHMHTSIPGQVKHIVFQLVFIFTVIKRLITFLKINYASTYGLNLSKHSDIRKMVSS